MLMAMISLVDVKQHQDILVATLGLRLAWCWKAQCGSTWCCWKKRRGNLLAGSLQRTETESETENLADKNQEIWLRSRVAGQ